MSPESRSWTRPPHLLVLVGLVALAFTFYAPVLNNAFWHPEDFHFLQTTIENASEPSRMFRLDAAERFHPIPLAVFLAEYSVFGLEPLGYNIVNLLFHSLNAFLVYLLVMALVPDRRIAMLSGILFVLGVGSYGKAVMFVAGIENLLITFLYLLILNNYIRNDLNEQGKILRPRYLLVVMLFLMVSFAKPTAFSLVGGLLAYKVFFHRKRGEGRRVLEPNLVILVVGAVAFWIVRELSGSVELTQRMAGRNPLSFSVNFVKNMVAYVVHMFFPIHVSRLVETSNPLVKAIYFAAPVIRWVVGISIVSYSFFGFVFGNRTIRFFLAWTAISLLPYCALTFPDDWLNIRYLYQVSIGFCFIMASGTVLSMDLLHRRRWRRFVPFLAPLIFVVLSGYITGKLDEKYEGIAVDPDSITRMEELHQMSAGELSY